MPRCRTRVQKIQRTCWSQICHAPVWGLRKKTDIRYKMSRGQQEELEALQRRILDTVCSYVKKDGIMVYSTCTINLGENQENVAWFLGKHPEFELLDMEQIYPGTQVGDGFFYARLRRIS